MPAIQLAHTPVSHSLGFRFEDEGSEAGRRRRMRIRRSGLLTARRWDCCYPLSLPNGVVVMAEQLSPVEVLDREFDAFEAARRSQGIRAARAACTPALYGFFDRLLERPWERGRDAESDRNIVARLGLLSCSRPLVDAAICKIVIPELSAEDFRQVALGGPLAPNITDTALDDVYEKRGYDVASIAAQYRADKGMPALLASAVGELPPDFRKGALDTAVFVSWAQGDDPDTVGEYCASLADVDPWSMTLGHVANYLAQGFRPAFRRDGQPHEKTRAMPDVFAVRLAHAR